MVSQAFNKSQAETDPGFSLIFLRISKRSKSWSLFRTVDFLTEHSVNWGMVKSVDASETFSSSVTFLETFSYGAPNCCYNLNAPF